MTNLDEAVVEEEDEQMRRAVRRQGPGVKDKTARDTASEEEQPPRGRHCFAP